jgi:transposase
MDTSKHVFQLHGVNVAEAPVLRRKLRRKEMVAFFEKLAPTVIAIEACGASHHCKNQTDRVETRFRNSR